jgi:predicted nucleic acid-binding protein
MTYLHVFWNNDISLLDEGRVDSTRLLSSAQTTDSYLLALAQAHGGQLATLDRRLVTTAVNGGARSLCLIG